jgi:hypothetical protein
MSPDVNFSGRYFLTISILSILFLTSVADIGYPFLSKYGSTAVSNGL